MRSFYVLTSLIFLPALAFSTSIASAAPDPKPFFDKALQREDQSGATVTRVSEPEDLFNRFVNWTAYLDDYIRDNSVRAYQLEIAYAGSVYTCVGTLNRPFWVQDSLTRQVSIGDCPNAPDVIQSVRGVEITLSAE